MLRDDGHGPDRAYFSCERCFRMRRPCAWLEDITDLYRSITNLSYISEAPMGMRNQYRTTGPKLEHVLEYSPIEEEDENSDEMENEQLSLKRRRFVPWPTYKT